MGAKMNSKTKSIVIALFGVATAVATAFANVMLINSMEFDLFSLFLFFIVPVGALIIGALATSGFYIGSSLLHKRADKFLLLLMFLVAALTMFLMYFIQYSMINVQGDIKLSDVMGFREFVELSFTEMSYGDSGAVGSFGYLIGGVQFLGILGGAWFVYSMLSGKAGCEICGNYFSSKAKKTLKLENTEGLQGYLDNLQGKSVESAEFAQVMSETENAGAGLSNETVRIDKELLACSGCEGQAMNMKVKVLDDGEWHDVPQLHMRLIPAEGKKLDHLFS